MQIKFIYVDAMYVFPHPFTQFSDYHNPIDKLVK